MQKFLQVLQPSLPKLLCREALTTFHVLKKLYPPLLGSFRGPTDLSPSIPHQRKTCPFNFFGVGGSKKGLQTMQNLSSRRSCSERHDLSLDCLDLGMSQLLSQTTSQNNVLAMESNLYAQIGVFICKMLFKGANFCGRGFPKQEEQPELCDGTGSRRTTKTSTQVHVNPRWVRQDLASWASMVQLGRHRQLD